jgi:hypothetical protein
MNDLNSPDRQLKHYCTNLSLDNFLSDSDYSATDTKLVFLSGLMSAIQNKHDKINECSSFHQFFQKGEWRANLLHFLVMILVLAIKLMLYIINSKFKLTYFHMNNSKLKLMAGAKSRRLLSLFFNFMLNLNLNN